MEASSRWQGASAPCTALRKVADDRSSRGRHDVRHQSSAWAIPHAGVELGQLVVLAVLLPVVTRLLVRPAVARHGICAVSIAVTASGVVWFVTRVYDLA